LLWRVMANQISWQPTAGVLPLRLSCGLINRLSLRYSLSPISTKIHWQISNYGVAKFCVIYCSYVFKGDILCCIRDKRICHVSISFSAGAKWSRYLCRVSPYLSSAFELPLVWNTHTNIKATYWQSSPKVFRNNKALEISLILLKLK
jgi:hypothetical protein